MFLIEHNTLCLHTRTTAQPTNYLPTHHTIRRGLKTFTLDLLLPKSLHYESFFVCLQHDNSPSLTMMLYCADYSFLKYTSSSPQKTILY